MSRTRPGHDAVGDDPHRHLPAQLVLGEPVAGRLEPDQPVDRRRDPDRAAAVVGVRDRDGAGGDQRRRAGRGGARRCAWCPTGERTGPSRGCSADGLKPNSRELGLAERHQPGGEVHPGEVAVRSAGGGARKASQPCWVGMPATSTLSLTKVGTPAKKPPRGSRASARARSKATYATALSSGWSRSVRAIAASTTSGIETSPSWIAATRPTASRSPRASSPKAWTRLTSRG